MKLTFNVDENGKIYQPLTVADKMGYGIEEEAIGYSINAKVDGQGK